MNQLSLLLDDALLEKAQRWARSQNMTLEDAIANFLQQLPEPASDSLEWRKSILKLPIAERRRILAEQAEAIAFHYEQDTEWKELQAGDIVEY
jgi:hypothetical protein